MTKTIFINIILTLLLIVILVINHYFENLKLLGIACVFLMVALGLMKEKIIGKDNKK